MSGGSEGGPGVQGIRGSEGAEGSVGGPGESVESGGSVYACRDVFSPGKRAMQRMITWMRFKLGDGFNNRTSSRGRAKERKYWEPSVFTCGSLQHARHVTIGPGPMGWTGIWLM